MLHTACAQREPSRSSVVQKLPTIEFALCYYYCYHTDAAQIVQELAAHTVDEAGFNEFLRANVERT